MLFRRQAYEKIGGHAAARQHAVDDIALGRRILTHGLRWRLVDEAKHLRCRMYHSLHQVFEGFSKNLFAAFEYRVVRFVFVWLWVGILFLEPVIVLALGLTAAVPEVSLGLAATGVGV